MIYFRRATERGTANFGWLQSRHSFSFGHYYDPQHMGFSVLRVINDDVVKGGAGFDTHGHKDMEIISYVLKGAIEHKDSEGNAYVVPAGDVQRMSAGTGILHSEFNHSKHDEVRFLQIWIVPNKQGITPSYEQKTVCQTEKLTPLVTADGRKNSLTMQQNASLYRLVLNEGDVISLSAESQWGYLHIIDGETQVGEHNLCAGDAIGVTEGTLDIQAATQLTALWFELPAQA
ncbi:pirin family protein [Alteromonas sp. ASW11-130]|uniref:pirin family protein n=1 Tax=Alteromonas sp. ASW11-130 TaxID=3015775 RepID=UPI0022419617|nr:pirin-like bicupin family protein [Alteromonas sp. ASW11-130]MCW8090232.1 pirin family protein [Alteromonas sp. ASW11-130]